MTPQWTFSDERHAYADADASVSLYGEIEVTHFVDQGRRYYFAIVTCDTFAHFFEVRQQGYVACLSSRASRESRDRLARYFEEQHGQPRGPIFYNGRDTSKRPPPSTKTVTWALLILTAVVVTAVSIATFF